MIYPLPFTKDVHIVGTYDVKLIFIEHCPFNVDGSVISGGMYNKKYPPTGIKLITESWKK